MNKSSAKEYLDTLDPETSKDAYAICEMMERVSSKKPNVWNEHTIGFDTYHYKYATGREGDNFIIGFYPRKGAITFYIMDGTARYENLLTKLGKHTVKGYCIIIKKLSDIDQTILEQILRESYDYIASLSKAGSIDRILWKTNQE